MVPHCIKGTPDLADHRFPATSSSTGRIECLGMLPSMHPVGSLLTVLLTPDVKIFPVGRHTALRLWSDIGAVAMASDM